MPITWPLSPSQTGGVTVPIHSKGFARSTSTVPLVPQAPPSETVQPYVPSARSTQVQVAPVSLGVTTSAGSPPNKASTRSAVPFTMSCTSALGTPDTQGPATTVSNTTGPKPVSTSTTPVVSQPALSVTVHVYDPADNPVHRESCGPSVHWTIKVPVPPDAMTQAWPSAVPGQLSAVTCVLTPMDIGSTITTVVSATQPRSSTTPAT